MYEIKQSHLKLKEINELNLHTNKIYCQHFKCIHTGNKENRKPL